MRSSYREEDVTLLLKDITGMVQPQSTQEREARIQAGVHYCEMLPIEYAPTQAYMEAYEDALRQYSAQTAAAVGILADKIIKRRGVQTALVSLARAGIPIGILLKRYIQWKYGVNLPHYAVSIIRGRGIDGNAMAYLLKRHRPQELLFVDGWIGKGAILRELQKEIARYEGVSAQIAALADPANATELCGVHEDILIPSSCLNCTVSGLISRTFLRKDIIGEKDFHGAVYYGELKEADLSYAFIEAIEKHFQRENQNPGGGKRMAGSGLDEVRQIAEKFGVDDLNFIKPGIGETTRVLLRRIPWKTLIDERLKGAPELRHVVQLAKEKQVDVEYYPLRHYKCCGIIRKIADA